MTDEQIALARRAVACKGWRWIPGMLTLDSDLILRVDDDGYKFAWRKYNYAYSPPADALPDLTDPATLGCLLALVRDAHGRRCYTQTVGGYWTVQNGDTDDAWGDHCATETEALVATLEAAP